MRRIVGVEREMIAGILVKQNEFIQEIKELIKNFAIMRMF